jgi:cytochrome c peroxidase
MKPLTIVGLIGVILALMLPQAAAQRDLDAPLRARLGALGIGPLEPPAASDPALVRLGEALFYDRILSGNRDTACATCHHPLLHTGDGLSLGFGTGTAGLGPERAHMPGRPFIPRNAPDLFNRGDAGFGVMFWDGRVILKRDGTLITPAGDALPPGLASALAAQAMFPVTSEAEMRGMIGDLDVFGADNTLALLNDRSLEPDYAAIWDALMDRLLAIPEYVTLFERAYPATSPDDMGFEHAANAIAAYEAAAFMSLNSPWDRYLGGDDTALSDNEKRGAMLFYGNAGCSNCHSGPLMTDQQFHNMAIPQIGPGKEEEAPEDYGRGRETGQLADRYRFRTPPLRNVALTGPYMHNGAYTSLEAAVRHIIGPGSGLSLYNPAQLTPELQAAVWNGAAMQAALLAALDPLSRTDTPLSDDDFNDLLAFLRALTDPEIIDMSALIPDFVPSGLPVDR